MTADSVRIRWVRNFQCLPTAFAFSMACWAMPAGAQSPVELSPPRTPAAINAPINSKPLSVAPPRTTTQTLIPPRASLTQLPPPAANDNSQRPTFVAPPSTSSQSVAQTGGLNDMTALEPAINAVRTQLEIISPPAAGTPTYRDNNAAQNRPSTIDAPSLSQNVGAAPARVLTVPPRSNQPIYISSPNTSNTSPDAPSSRVATLTPPNNSTSRPATAPVASILEIQAPPVSAPSNNSQFNNSQFNNSQFNNSQANSQPRSNNQRSNSQSGSIQPNNTQRSTQSNTQANSQVSTQVNTQANSQANNEWQPVHRQQVPTRIAQSPQSQTLPDNYRPLAPPAQPGPQAGAAFSQVVGSNQVTIIPPPGSPSASQASPSDQVQDSNGLVQSSGASGAGGQLPSAQAQNILPPNRIVPTNPSIPSVGPMVPGPFNQGSVSTGSFNAGNPGGIEIINVTPGGMAPGTASEMVGGANEPMWQFNFQNAPWPVVIRNFAKQNGMALQMLAEPTGAFTFVDERPYPASEALDLLNDYLLHDGCLLVRNGNKLTTVTAGGPIQEGIVPFVPMRQIEILGRNELASVAIPIRATDAAMVMNEVQALLSRVGRAQVVSNSSRLVITDTGAYLRRARDIIGGYGLAAGDMQTVVVHLKNTTADSMSSTISAHLGISLGASSVVTAGGTGSPGGVQTASFSSNTTVNNSSTRVIPDRETNSLLISGTPAEVAEIQSLICQLDQARAQVILQGLILEVNLGNVNELGAEVGLQDSVLFNRSVIDNLVTLQNTNTAPNGVQTTSQNVISQTSAPGFNFNGSPLGNNTAVSPNVLGAQGLGNLGVGRTNSQLGFGGLVLSASSNSVSLLLRALQANYEVDVLSRPQIRTVDNKEAFIQIGQQVPVVDGVNVTAVGTANPIIRQDQAGIILKMTPNVSPDGMIQIKVSAEKSAFKLQPGTGVPIFTDARNGTVIQAPIKDITTAQATISARAGQTIVLGGMITRDEETIQRRVPGLSRIPLLGRLFRYDYNNTTRKELLIFLTPHLIADDASSDAYKDAEIARTHAPLERAAEIHGQLLTNPPVVVEEEAAQ